MKAISDEQLRADIRRLGNQLGDALVRQHGPELLDLVETVRALGKSVRRGGSAEATQELDQLLSQLEVGDVIALVRAFTTYFYLANVTEQVHRVDQLATDDRYLKSTVDRILEADVDEQELIEVLSRLEVRPVFTAHPTEAARRSILSKTRQLADLIEQRLGVQDDDTRSMIDRRSAELIDQIWQTDELRLQRPSPVEEARSALYYLVQVADEVMPALADHVAFQLERLGPPVTAPIRFGSWVGGDRDGNPEVTPETTLETLILQHDRGLRHLISLVESLADELSMSQRLSPISEGLEISLAEDREHLPEIWQRENRRTAAEPYRLKCSYIHARLINTNLRIQRSLPFRVGHDYADPSGLLADLDIMDGSLRAARGQLIADGALARVRRAAMTFGFQMATLDVREHAAKHRSALSEVYSLVDTNYDRLDAVGRQGLLGSELAGSRPLTGPNTVIGEEARNTIGTFHAIAEAKARYGDQVIE
ncbi:MAG TPA: phosphoenolpyruvate carboxylase, partial [Acidimicrobiia bacterium]